MRVSSADQRPDLDRQVARLTEWATSNKLAVTRVVSEVGSALNGARPKLKRLLADPDVSVIAVEDDGAVEDDLVRDMTEVLTSFVARLYGKSAARNRAKKALAAAQEDCA